MTSTEEFIAVLGNLKTGELGLLRTHAGQGLDESVPGFDLFAGLWWPLRKKNQRAPRREVAWLIAKLYASCPLRHSPGHTLARQLRRSSPKEKIERQRFGKTFDNMLVLPVGQIEQVLRQAILTIASTHHQLDWVKLTDDLSRWESEAIRLRWAEEFLENNGGI